MDAQQDPVAAQPEHAAQDTVYTALPLYAELKVQAALGIAAKRVAKPPSHEQGLVCVAVAFNTLPAGVAEEVTVRELFEVWPYPPACVYDVLHQGRKMGLLELIEEGRANTIRLTDKGRRCLLEPDTTWLTSA